MITALLLTSLAVAPVEATVVAQPQTPVKVWLNKRGNLKQGDRVRVYARTEEDGYLLILHAEPDGRIRVLLPLDPFDDNYIRGGRDVELRGRGDREAFRVYEMEGYGTVYAAFSRDPFQADAFIRGDHWDYRLFDSWRLNENLDPEAELTALVREMAGGGHFDYDLTQYYVGERVASVGTYYGDSYYYPATYSVGFGWSRYPRSWGVSIGWGLFGVWSDPWYDPWYGWGYYPYSRYAYWPYSYWGSYYYDPYYYSGYYVRYPVRYAGTYYNPRGYYTTAFGDHVRGPYTFKAADRGLASGGITARRRSPTTGGSFASRTTLTQDVAARLTGRRTAPATVDRAVQTPRTGATNTGRRVAPSTTDAARRTVDTRGETTDRRVEPAGWGITDGRRTITPERRTPTSGTAAQRRSVPDRTTVTQPATRRPTADVPADRGTSERRATPSTTTRTIETPTPSRTRTETTAPRRETPTVRQPPTPTRTTVRRSDPPAPTTSRTAPTQRSAPRSVPAPSRTPTRSTVPAPSRSTPTRSAAPARQSAPRPSAPRPVVRTPSPASRPAARPSSRPASSRGTARPPTSSSRRRGGK